MAKQETGLTTLEQFLPPNTFGMVIRYFKKYPIHLTLTKERKTVLGDYRPPTRKDKHHRISLNINLNKYNFLITLLHELAHLVTWENYRERVSPHGKEWKEQFRTILLPFIGKKIFPMSLEKALVLYLRNPAASTCTDPGLFKALYKYDKKKPNYKLIDDLEAGHWFQIEDGRVFEKIEQLRTRSLCKELGTRKKYFFPGIYEVKHVRRDRRLIA